MVMVKDEGNYDFFRIGYVLFPFQKVALRKEQLSEDHQVRKNKRNLWINYLKYMFYTCSRCKKSTHS